MKISEVYKWILSTRFCQTNFFERLKATWLGVSENLKITTTEWKMLYLYLVFKAFRFILLYSYFPLNTDLR